MAVKEKLILVTNDDGITSPGIRALIEAVRPLGRVVVVAPDSPQSGMGHAITIGVPLRLNQVDIFEDIEAWQCSGTPVDCVKLARDKILGGRKPDLCVSGINHGANHSINVIYSGTMSAAMEAAIEGIPSAGFSFLEYDYTADFSLPAKVAREVAERMLSSELPVGTLFNVNIPIVEEKNFRGIKICRQADAKWVEEFDERRDPHGKKYYWLTGEFKNRDTGDDTDVWALENGYASLVPVQFDLTNYKLKQQLEEEWKDLK
ncbi:5'-nucleotidase /3'-nucleotidase /exopolyphosphatase [Chitinophaga jiangningensis]|uniref:5'-nucleotidase SurE n=1 Tax=Chitinophaga jiangningensis TaxID=1419482 RepID=A0A1M6WBP7_9BACT|nr:5'/3'-nucleotidase SurE [Chitinophaga jiangningensis]SHK91114.1 5'-nucleotidase /3'-nucleotidase /exopolyphosphatase [Chitinophaga jiangningensis]